MNPEPGIDVTPLALEGPRVRLEPLDLARHWEGLLAIGLEPELWRWTMSTIATADELRAYLETALAKRAAGRALPFATVERVTGRIAGSTRFGSIDRENRRAEIGWTWLGAPFRRTSINTEAKYLMLRHGFERWGCRRVELKTHVHNQRSREAIQRIGARFEGVLRRYQTGPNGTRDTAMFSVVDLEWPAVRARLEAMMRGERVPPLAPDSSDQATATG